MKITSFSNPKFKELRKLSFENKKRKEGKVFLVEGKREIQMALKGGYIPVELFFCKSSDENQVIFELFPKLTFLDFELFSALVYRKNRDNLLALFEKKETSFSRLRLSPCPIIWILENVEKPGNLGAVLRTADALKVDLVVICGEKIDFFHPHVIRSSLGAVFTTEIFYETSDNIYTWLSANKIKVFVSALQENSKNLYQIDFRSSCALIVGAEDRGVSDFWIDKADSLIKIPMHGIVNSLNVSVATAIMGAEIIRQRKNFN